MKHASSNGESASYNTKDFKLQKSIDGTNWTDVDSVTGNTAATTDRTVTLGDRSNARIYEFEVYGNQGAYEPS